MSVLGRILDGKREEVARLRAPQRRTRLAEELAGAPPVRDLTTALRGPGTGLAVIAEIKRRSPSKGDLAPDLDPATTAKAYATGGAAALSVLTDGPWFGGSPDDLREARAAVELPVLRKDFVVDPLQLDESRAMGADATLLVVAALPDDGLVRELLARAADLGLAALVEVHDEPELDRALAAGAGIVGVNCRDLRTFGEDLAVAERLATRLPDGVVRVAESAVRSPADARRMADAGFHAVLVGEALVRADDPIAAVRALVRAEKGR
ncbi:MAG: indole-3-glycerol phosphate synthase TrpC [Acidimicrobiia bacterium]|nr:indole-3-glycerol phosphate synthase TrpC [Acidimicrobiia bacterium]